MHKMYVEKIIAKANKEDMIKLEEVFDKAVEHIKECDPDLYDCLELELYEILNGKHFTEEKAKHWVMNMEPVGQKYTLEETTQAMQRLGFVCDKFDFYIATNMMANNYHNITKDDQDFCYKLAYSFLKDEDAVDGKLFEYYKYIVKKD